VVALSVQAQGYGLKYSGICVGFLARQETLFSEHPSRLSGPHNLVSSHAVSSDGSLHGSNGTGS
jgi:hypothetical protein